MHRLPHIASGPCHNGDARPIPRCRKMSQKTPNAETRGNQCATRQEMTTLRAIH